MWINPVTAQTFTLHSEIRSAFPDTSFRGELREGDIAFIGLMPVETVPAPSVNRATQRVVETPPTLIGDVWTQQWVIEELSGPEQQVVAQQIQAELTQAIQARLDAFAATRNYSGIMSLCTYATSTVPQFQIEAQCGVDLRDATWATCYQILGEVGQGLRPMPTQFSDIEAELPTLAWPV